MAKTALLRSLLQVYARSRSAPKRPPVSVSAVAPRIRRRALLGAGVALGVGACAPQGAPAAAPTRKGPRLAIVGAGLAGLHAAHRLAELGVPSTLFEGSKRMGGRVFTDHRTFEPQHCELGGELIDTGHATMHALAEELGIRLFDYQRQRGKQELRVSFGSQLLGEREILDAFAPVAKAIDKSLEQLKDPNGSITYRSPNGAAALDALSIQGWFDAHGVKGFIRELLEVAYTTEFGLEPDESSALNLLWMISTELSRFQVYGESDERFHAREGSESYASRLAERIDGQTIELEQRLVRVAGTAAGRYQLSFEAGAKIREEIFDEVMLCLPFSLLRQVELKLELPAVKRRAIAELGYGRNTKLMLGFGARYWRSQGLSGETYADLGYQSTWDTSRMQPSDAGLLTNFTGGAQSDVVGRAELKPAAQALLGQLEQVLPGALERYNGRVARFAWNDHDWTRGSYSAWKPGQYTTLAGSEGEAVGGLYFAGEHTSVNFQGYMEGAVSSGARAALQVLNGRGLSRLVAQAPPVAAKIWKLAAEELKA